LSIPVINADEIARQLLEEDRVVFAAICTKFGPEILTANQQIDRNKLRNIIFNSPTDKSWLEQLLHPLIKQQIATQTQSLQNPYCIVEIPLLIEAHMQDLVDRILTIDCPEKSQIERAMRRDHSSKEVVQSVMDSQTTRKVRLASSHDIIDNSSDLAALKKLVMHQHNYYLSLATQQKH